MAMAPVFVEIRGTISDLQAKLGEARGELDKMQAKGESSMSSFGAFGKSSFMAVEAAAVALGTEAIHLADAFEVSHARLTASLVANGTSFDAWSTQIGAADKAGERLGFSNQVVEDGLARLEQMVHDPAVALKDLAVAEDVARARGMDLTTASNLVGKASEGTYTSLVKLGVVTKDQAAAFTSGAQAVQFLGQQFAGQASAYAETFGGKLAVLKATTEDLGKNLGLWLIPKIEEVATALSSSIHFVEDHRAAQALLAGVITALVVPALGRLGIALYGDFVKAAAAAWTAMAELVVSASAVSGAFVMEGEAAAVAGIGFGAMLGPIGILAGVVAGAVILFRDMAGAADHVGTATQQAARSFASDFVQSVSDSLDPAAALSNEIELLTRRQKDGVWITAEQARTGETANEVVGRLKATVSDLGQTQLNQNVATQLGIDADMTSTETKKTLTQALTDANTALSASVTDAQNYFNSAESGISADIAWANNKDALTTALAKSKGSLDINTQAGRASLTVVDSLTSATDKNIAKVLASGQTADQMRPLIQGYIDKLHATERQTGLTAAQIAALDIQYGLTPSEVTTQVNLVGVSLAEQQIAAIRAGLAAIGQSAAQVEAQVAAATNPHGPGGGVGASAAAGVITPHAAGGPFSAGERMLVGERGPELVSFGTGGMVTPNNQLGVAGGGGASGGGDIVLQIDGQTIARIVRAHLLRQGRSMTSIGLA